MHHPALSGSVEAHWAALDSTVCPLKHKNIDPSVHPKPDKTHFLASLFFDYLE